jgi:hypothetical protein
MAVQRVEPPNGVERRHLCCGLVYERVLTQTVDVMCFKDLDKDFCWMVLFVTLMSIGVFVYAV